ncbi:HNH endonuclease signature motif containing protein [Iamia sp.]|uniref:HNH endonuclease signature motif containing protein n=1 Tax=Iamia sp. TaxID=2722710 RepID=UPI002C5852E1|nr:DUF222 domain-containing protein [Iamia sp.]HXH55669.1 DUF222 domain-containing protein [Iamia sp.]
MTTDLSPEAAQETDAARRAFDDELAGVAGVRNAADARLVDLVVRALAEGLWQGHRVRTPVQWLMWRAGVSRAVAQRVVALARRAPVLPVTMAMFTGGRLSFDQAATVARYTPGQFEASVAEVAQFATVPQIATATRTYGFDTEARPADAPEPTPDDPVLPDPEPEVDREVAFGTEESGQWWARMRLPADEGMAIEGALKAARERLHSEARAAARARAKAEGRSMKDLDVRPPSWADAAVGVAHSILAGGAGGAEMAARSRILLHLETPDGTRGHGRWMGSLHLGGVLPDELRRYLSCDGDAQIIWHKDGAPVNVGRAHRIVPRRIRRLIEHRDRGCRVPGCDQTYWLQIHHIVHWEDDGETITTNLICLCSAHHRMHHQGLLGIVGHADHPEGVTFTDRYGNHLNGATRARPPKATDMPTVGAYRCPTGERLDRSAVHFNRTPSPAPDDAADDPGPTSDHGPPGRRRHAHCRTTGRAEAATPDGSRAPPMS